MCTTKIHTNTTSKLMDNACTNRLIATTSSDIYLNWNSLVVVTWIAVTAARISTLKIASIQFLQVENINAIHQT